MSLLGRLSLSRYLYSHRYIYPSFYTNYSLFNNDKKTFFSFSSSSKSNFSSLNNYISTKNSIIYNNKCFFSTSKHIHSSNQSSVDSINTNISSSIPDSFKGKILYYINGYKSLSKAKLSSLVLSTTILGYAMAPGCFDLSTFIIVTGGTWLTICSANSINQIIEVNNDSQMNRTKKRWLPTKKLSVQHAKIFAITTGITGVGSLLLINPMTSSLALFNLILYTAIYTPMKQKKPANTWIGAIVGAVPPMIGWAAGTGGIELGSWLIGSLLAFWQMPHFMALSYSLKDDYHRGGFKMLINTNPDKVPGVILRYSFAMIPIGLISSLSGMTTWLYALDSLLPTGYLTYLALKFYKKQDRETARNMFKFSLLMLPLMMGLMFLHKNPEPSPSSATLTELKENISQYFMSQKSDKGVIIEYNNKE